MLCADSTGGSSASEEGAQLQKMWVTFRNKARYKLILYIYSNKLLLSVWSPLLTIALLKDM